MIYLVAMFIFSIAQADSVYFPMTEGMIREYHETRNDGSQGPCAQDGRVTITTHSVKIRGDVSEATLTMTPYCWGTNSIPYRQEGEFLRAQTDSVNWYNMLKFPPVQGDSWPAGYPSGASTYWVKHHATITVSAGTFADCWESKQVGYEVRSFYCRDVGLVLMEQTSWGDLRWELVRVTRRLRAKIPEPFTN